MFKENHESKFKEDIEEFLGDFPYQITIKKKFEDI